MRLVQWYHVVTRERYYSVCFETREETGRSALTSYTTAQFSEIVNYNGPYDYYFDSLSSAMDWSSRHCQETNKFLKGCYNEKK